MANVSHYSSITIIYNPSSRGSSKRLALDLQSRLARKLSSPAVQVMPTEYPGHAEKIAYDMARGSAHALVVSSSGDGGYHEVINGLIRAKKAGTSPVAGLLPAGNANDHYHNGHRDDIATAIVAGKEQSFDLLKLKTIADGHRLTRYAHSYIGLGLTPAVSKNLSKKKKHLPLEMLTVALVLLHYKPIKILIDGTEHSYDSLVFSNVRRMAKYFWVAPNIRLNDGKFAVIGWPKRSMLGKLLIIFRAMRPSKPAHLQIDSFNFQTKDSTPVQLDGEVVTIDANAKTAVSIESRVIDCII